MPKTFSRFKMLDAVKLAKEELTKPDPNPFYLAMLGVFKEEKISLEEAKRRWDSVAPLIEGLEDEKEI